MNGLWFQRITLAAIRFPSILEGPNGKLKMESTWKILDDGRKYLSTVVTKPINKI